MSKKNRSPGSKNKELIKKVLSTEELTDKEKMFCLYYSASFNATRSYYKVYNCTLLTAGTEGNKLLKKPKIRKLINELTALNVDVEALRNNIVQQQIDIALSDITDFVEFGTKEYPFFDTEGKPVLDKDGNVMTYSKDYIKVKDSKEINGRLVTSISKGKEGIKISLANKDKALEWLSNHLYLLSDEQKEKLRLQEKHLELKEKQIENNSW